jgi:hypothetical protein
MKISLVEATESGAELMTRRRVLEVPATAYGRAPPLARRQAGRAVNGVSELRETRFIQRTC